MPRAQRASDGSEAGWCLDHIYTVTISLEKGRRAKRKSPTESEPLTLWRSLKRQGGISLSVLQATGQWAGLIPPWGWLGKTEGQAMKLGARELIPQEV